jgi:anaerobic ribonucleoside-triphosphate reductase activating protein
VNEAFFRLHHFMPRSRANGPGVRAVAWLQGCSLGCPGCFNPQTHPFEGGEQVSVSNLFERIQELACGKEHRDCIEGVSLSGGEPLQQARPLAALLKCIRQETALSTLVFSGYRLNEIERDPEMAACLPYIDVLIAGRYCPAQRLASGLLGSSNQVIHLLTPRYQLADLQIVPDAEVQITPDGQVLFTGIDPLL